MSFAENSIGTNAIALSIGLKKPFYVSSQQHYCKFLKRFNCYAIPIWRNEKFAGCMAVSTIEHPLKMELVAITDLLGYYIANELNRKDVILPYRDEKIVLTEKCLAILQLLATGKTDKAIAAEMKVCIDTIKYHKKNIFRALDAGCTMEAVIKALRLNLISINQFNL